VYGLEVLEKFEIIPQCIPTNPKQLPFKPLHRILCLRQWYQSITRDLGCIHWCKRKPSRWEGIAICCRLL